MLFVFSKIFQIYYSYLQNNLIHMFMFCLPQLVSYTFLSNIHIVNARRWHVFDLVWLRRAKRGQQFTWICFFFFLLLMIIVGIVLETVFESLTVIKTFLKRMIYISLHTYFFAFEIRLPHSVKLTDEHLRSLSLVSIQTRDVHFSVDPNGVAILDVFERNPFICWNTTI